MENRGSRVNKKRRGFVTITLSMIILFWGTVDVQASSEKIEELEKQQKDFEKQSDTLDFEIQSRDQQKQVMENEKAQLEIDVVETQKRIDELVLTIDEQEKELDRLNAEIEQLEKKIQDVQSQIEIRSQQLTSQARSMQIKGNPGNVIGILLSSESLSDFIARVGVITQLVSANQTILQDQMDDQLFLEESEKKIAVEKEEIEKVKEQINLDVNSLVHQRDTLDSKIMQLAEKLKVTDVERSSLVSEQLLIVERTSLLDSEIQQEQQRMVEEENRKAEQERVAEQKKIEEQNRIAERERTDKQESAGESKEETALVSTSSSDSSILDQSNSAWVVPAQGRVSSPYGWRTHPIYKTRNFHTGIDIAGSGPIISARSGKVVTVSYSNSLGYYVEIDHGDGYKTVYSHMQSNLMVSVGETVSQGQQIGVMGTTGDSTGVHLDFKIYKNGTTVDPAPYIGL